VNKSVKYLFQQRFELISSSKNCSGLSRQCSRDSTFYVMGRPSLTGSGTDRPTLPPANAACKKKKLCTVLLYSKCECCWYTVTHLSHQFPQPWLAITNDVYLPTVLLQEVCAMLFNLPVHDHFDCEKLDRKQEPDCAISFALLRDADSNLKYKVNSHTSACVKNMCSSQ
jgi:hypothetical protein